METNQCPNCGKPKYIYARICRNCYYEKIAPKDVETVRAWTLGKTPSKNGLMYKQTCPACGVVMYRRKKLIGTRCMKCALGDGTHKTNHGYIMTSKFEPEFAVMANKEGYCFEHRLVMARFLGRPLLAKEVVHHRNGIKDDNRLENLQLLNGQTEHNTYPQQLKDAQIRIQELEKEVRLLKIQMKSLLHGNAELNLGSEPSKCVEVIHSASTYLDDDMTQPYRKL